MQLDCEMKASDVACGIINNSHPSDAFLFRPTSRVGSAGAVSIGIWRVIDNDENRDFRLALSAVLIMAYTLDDSATWLGVRANERRTDHVISAGMWSLLPSCSLLDGEGKTASSVCLTFTQYNAGEPLFETVGSRFI